VVANLAIQTGILLRKKNSSSIKATPNAFQPNIFLRIAQCWKR